MRVLGRVLAMGLSAAIPLVGVMAAAPAWAAPVSDEEARSIVTAIVEGRFAKRPGYHIAHFAPVTRSIQLGESRRVFLQNLSYGTGAIRVQLGDVDILVEPPTAVPGEAPSSTDSVGPLYPVSFHLPEAMVISQSGKPFGSIAIGYSSIRAMWAPKISSFLGLDWQASAMTLLGVKEVAASIAGLRFQQDGHMGPDGWSGQGTFGVTGIKVRGGGATFSVAEVDETVSFAGLPLRAWYDIGNQLIPLIPDRPETQTEKQQEALVAAMMALFSKAPRLADHLAAEFKIGGISVEGGGAVGSLDRLSFSLGYEDQPAPPPGSAGGRTEVLLPTAPVTPSAADSESVQTGSPAIGEADPAAGLGSYHFGYAMAGLGVPLDAINSVVPHGEGAFVDHSIPRDIRFSFDAANVPTRALLALARRAAQTSMARGSGAPTTDAPSDTVEKAAGDAWTLLKQVKSSIGTDVDIATDLVKITSTSKYVADASQPSGQTNMTKISVSGLDALLASYVAPEHKPAIAADPKAANPKTSDAKTPDSKNKVQPRPKTGAKGPDTAPDKLAELDEGQTVLNFALLGIRFVKGVGVPRADNGAIVYDYTIETQPDGTTLINGQNFVAMIESLSKSSGYKL